MLTRSLGFDLLHVGPWLSAPKSGTLDAEPYTKAMIARSGQIPLGIAEGVSFIATRDQQGHAFSSQCVYRLTDPEPSARVWTITLLRRDGLPLEGDHHALTSQELVRDDKGHFVISLSRTIRPLNWLALPPQGSFLIMLRLYDSAVSLSSSALKASDLPQIITQACS
jgi:hypothetical protein